MVVQLQWGREPALRGGEEKVSELRYLKVSVKGSELRYLKALNYATSR